MTRRNVVYFPIHRRPHLIEDPVTASLTGGRRKLEASCKRNFFAIERWMKKAGATRAEVDQFVAEYCLEVDAEIARRLSLPIPAMTFDREEGTRP